MGWTRLDWTGLDSENKLYILFVFERGPMGGVRAIIF